VVLQR